MKWTVIKGTGTPPYKPGDKLDLTITLYQSSEWDGSHPEASDKGIHTATVVDATTRTLICTVAGQALTFYPGPRLWSLVTKHILPW